MVDAMDKRILVVYYSWLHEHTKRVAELAARATGADIVRIETVEPYRGSFDDVMERGKREVDELLEPPIKDLGIDLDDYSFIVVGTPTWWYSMAPAVRTFLRSQTWAGRTVVPFMTCSGWRGHVIADMEELCAGARFERELEVVIADPGSISSVLATSKEELDSWADSLKNLL
jgi:flavodoxin